MLGILILAVCSDVRTEKIRNKLILAGLETGFLIQIYEKGISFIPLWFIQISIPIFLFYPIFRIGALGAGDIKLFSVIAGFLTLKTWWVCVEAAFLAGAAMGLFKLLFKNYVKDAHMIHFSVPILAGYLYYLGVVR